jgi:hypothetical protein
MKRTSLIFSVGFLMALCIAALWSLSRDKAPNVVYAKQLEMDVGQRCGSIDTPVHAQKYEVFIIQNPPKERTDLMNLIRKNEKFAPIYKELVEQRYEVFSRHYYKESRQTPIDFRSGHGGFFNRDYIYDHIEDEVCDIKMQRLYHGPDSLRVTWECSCPELEDVLLYRPR